VEVVNKSALASVSAFVITQNLWITVLVNLMELFHAILNLALYGMDLKAAVAVAVAAVVAVNNGNGIIKKNS
jgi:hypothetical protein